MSQLQLEIKQLIIDALGLENLVASVHVGLLLRRRRGWR